MVSKFAFHTLFIGYAAPSNKNGVVLTMMISIRVRASWTGFADVSPDVVEEDSTRFAHGCARKGVNKCNTAQKSHLITLRWPNPPLGNDYQFL